MYFYVTKRNKNEQAQLLEMCGSAILFDGIGCNGVKQVLSTNIEKCGQIICSHFFIADALG